MRVRRATSIDGLAHELVRHLAEQPPDRVLAPVEVAVPSRGMERWLTQRLAGGLGAAGGEAGVCANVAFPFPGALVQRALGAVLGDEVPEDDPWAPQRLAWPVLELLDDLPDDEVYAPLRAHLADRGERAERRRFPLARRIADLFDRYALYRADMVARWADGEAVDADGQPLPDNVAWQPTLWRELARRIGSPSPDQRFQAALAALHHGRIARPERLAGPLTIFGMQSLPPLHLELLDALAAHVEVTLHVIAPVAVWVPGRSPERVRHPLLASCGQAARSAHVALAPYEREQPTEARGPAEDDGGGVAPDAGAETTSGAVPGRSAASALAVLQDDLRSDRARGPRDHPPVPLADGDRTIQVHACHGPMRQLEALREVLLGLLEDEPTLEPRDIVVLTPDIETYDPMIRAVFSDGDGPGGADEASGTGVPALPFRVADRTVRDDNVVAQVLLTVCELVTSRVGASAVLDLLGTPPVRARFGLSAADLATLPDWIQGTGISWGIDADHRAELIGIDDRAHTWAAGLDRLVLGAAMPDDRARMVDGVVPYDDVEGSAVELLGRLATATDALFACLRALRRPRTVAAWRAALEDVVDTLLDPGPGPRVDAELTSQLAAVREALATMVDDSHTATDGPSDVELTLEEIRSVLGDHLGERGGRAQYGSGAVTFAGLVPLRNVPHRVVCLVGLDDGALPRASHRHGFDLITSQPRDGDPDPRIEDRALLLDAILSARDHLVLTYTGHDPRTNEAQQPAVPVSELLDVLDRTFTREPSAASERLVTHHPLQPHSPRYFREAEDDEAPVPRAFDRRQLAAARAAASTAAGRTDPPRPFFPPDRPLPPPGEDELDPVIVELDDLLRFLAHPVRHLLQRRVGISLGEDDRRIEDRDPTELDGLGRWRLGQELLDQRLAAVPVDRWRELTLACGTVPVGGLGEVTLDGIEELVDKLCSRVDGIEGERRQLAVDVRVPVPGPPGSEPSERRLVGSVELHGSTLLHISVSTLKAKHRIPTWARLLAATVMAPDLEPSGRLLGRDTGLAAGFRDRRLQPLAATRDPVDERGPADLARAHLGELVALYLRGHVEPVPLLPETSLAYVRCRVRDQDHAEALATAQRTWAGNDKVPGEQADPYVVQAFGADRDLADLDRATTFGVDAERIWRPVVAAEVDA